ncbi:MAG: galactitol-1-phosphate 5-dehydrogenase [Lachnospiraceae bacterium]|nr:galactitol-1-phosphate 5-dehydrogenase [Lachnospiraceae bacterium]
MKAWKLHGINDIRFGEAEYPVPKDDEVLVKVKAAGICGSDIPRIYETGAHQMPLIPGHEFSGEVRDIGKDVSEKWIGKRVGVFPLIPCGKCPMCRQKKYEMCRDYDYLGSRRDGAFAEYVAVPEWNLLELPENVSFEQAAMLEPMAVAVHAARRGTDGFSIPKDAAIAVCGLGTIGSFVIMFLREAGYKNIFAIGNHGHQRDRIKVFGVEEDNFCNAETTDAEEWLAEKTDDLKVYFECVGKNETAALGIKSAGASGRVVMVGNPYSGMSFDRDTYWRILRNELTVLGSWNSSFQHEEDDDWHYALNRIADGRITPVAMISHRLRLENLKEGTRMMRDKSGGYGKMVVVENGKF